MLKRVFLILFIISFTLKAELIINDEQNIYTNFKVNLLIDRSKSLTIYDIEKKDFSKEIKNSFALSYIKANAWLKIEIKNSSKTEDFIVYLNELFYEEFTLFYKEKDKWINKKNGVGVLLHDREVLSNNLAHKLEIKKNENKTIYVKLNGKYSYFGELSIIKEKNFYKYSIYWENLFYIFNLGVIISILFFTFFLFLKIKEKVYLYYFLYVVSYSIYLFKMSPFVVQFELQKYIYLLHLTTPFLVIFLILFSREILNTKKYLKKIDLVLIFTTFVSFVFLFLLYFQFSTYNKIFNNLVTTTFVLLTISALIIYIKEKRELKLYIFAITFYFATVICFTLMIKGNLEYSYFTRFAYLVGSLVELLLFTLILSNRYDKVQKNLIKMQKDIIKDKSFNEDFLEKEVKKRVNEIEEKNRELNILLEDRELLLREVYHRVKNNFQLIIGILWLESRKKDLSSHSFNNLISRVKSMSIIHEFLYKSDNLSSISSTKYLNNIIRNLSSIYKDKGFVLNKEIDDVHFDFNDSMALGIIVNEVLTNSIKYNCSEKPEINFLLKKEEGEIILSIKDNGKNFDISNTSSGLGLKLIEQFVSKISNSKYDYIFDDGVEFLLRIKA